MYIVNRSSWFEQTSEICCSKILSFIDLRVNIYVLKRKFLSLFISHLSFFFVVVWRKQRTFVFLFTKIWSEIYLTPISLLYKYIFDRVSISTHPSGDDDQYIWRYTVNWQKFALFIYLILYLYLQYILYLSYRTSNSNIVVKMRYIKKSTWSFLEMMFLCYFFIFLFFGF